MKHSKRLQQIIDAYGVRIMPFEQALIDYIEELEQVIQEAIVDVDQKIKEIEESND